MPELTEEKNASADPTDTSMGKGGKIDMLEAW